MQIARTFKLLFLNSVALYHHYLWLDQKKKITFVSAWIAFLLSGVLETHFALEMELVEYILENTNT